MKESTLANYQLKADKHILPVYRDCNITEVNANSIYQFIKDKQDSGLSNRYITDILVLMKSVFKYAARTYRIFNAMDGLVMPKKEKTEVLLLTPEQEKKLMRILMANPALTNAGITPMNSHKSLDILLRCDLSRIKDAENPSYYSKRSSLWTFSRKSRRSMRAKFHSISWNTVMMRLLIQKSLNWYRQK